MKTISRLFKEFIEERRKVREARKLVDYYNNELTDLFDELRDAHPDSWAAIKTREQIDVISQKLHELYQLA